MTRSFTYESIPRAMAFYDSTEHATAFISLCKWHFPRYTLYSQITETLTINSKVLDILDTGWRKSSKTEENFWTALLLNAIHGVKLLLGLLYTALLSPGVHMKAEILTNKIF